MPLLVDRLPLHSWIAPGDPAQQPRWSVSLEVIPSNPGLDQPPVGSKPQRWAIDTRFSGEAYAWRHHLVEAGLDPDALRSGSVLLTPVGGTPARFPTRDADLWLVSNLPGVKPWRLELDLGIALRDTDRLPDPEVNCPLLGMGALAPSGLRIAVNFAKSSISVWSSGTWYAHSLRELRRVATGFATRRPSWAK